MELDQLWMPKCVRLGWRINFCPTPFEQGVWKRHYIRTVQELQVGGGGDQIQRLRFSSVVCSSSTKPQCVFCASCPPADRLVLVPAAVAGSGRVSRQQRTRGSVGGGARRRGASGLRPPAAPGHLREEAAAGRPAAAVEGLRQASQRHAALQLPGQPGARRRSSESVRLRGT